MSRTAPRWLAVALAAVMGSALIVYQSATALAADLSTPMGGAPAPLVTDADGPLFGGAPLAPGDSESRCVEITYTAGPDAVEARMLASVRDDGLGDWIEVSVDLGHGGGYDDCTAFTPETEAFAGTLADLVEHDGYGDGFGAWTASPGDARTYRITTTLLDGSPAGATADADFHWEVRAP